MWVYVYVNTCICACVWVQCVHVEARSLKLMSGILLDQPPFPYTLRQGFSEYLANLAFFHRPPCQTNLVFTWVLRILAWMLMLLPVTHLPSPIVLIFTFVRFAKSLPWSSLLHSLAFEACQRVAPLSSLALLSISLHNRMYEMKLLAYLSPQYALFFCTIFPHSNVCSWNYTYSLQLRPDFSVPVNLKLKGNIFLLWTLLMFLTLLILYMQTHIYCLNCMNFLSLICSVTHIMVWVKRFMFYILSPVILRLKIFSKWHWLTHSSTYKYIYSVCVFLEYS